MKRKINSILCLIMVGLLLVSGITPFSVAQAADATFIYSARLTGFHEPLAGEYPYYNWEDISPETNANYTISSISWYRIDSSGQRYLMEENEPFLSTGQTGNHYVLAFTLKANAGYCFKQDNFSLAFGDRPIDCKHSVARTGESISVETGMYSAEAKDLTYVTLYGYHNPICNESVSENVDSLYVHNPTVNGSVKHFYIARADWYMCDDDGVGVMSKQLKFSYPLRNVATYYLRLEIAPEDGYRMTNDTKISGDIQSQFESKYVDQRTGNLVIYTKTVYADVLNYRLISDHAGSFLYYTVNGERLSNDASFVYGSRITVEAKPGMRFTSFSVSGVNSLITDTETMKVFLMPKKDTAINSTMEDIRYQVSQQKTGNGCLTVGNRDQTTIETAIAGNQIRFYTIADDGYTLGTVKVIGSDGTEIPTKLITGGVHSFTMPAQNVTVEVEFIPFVSGNTVTLYNNCAEYPTRKVTLKVGSTYQLPTNIDGNELALHIPETQYLLGWSYTPNGEIIQEDTIPVSGNVNLYAIWANKTYRVVFSEPNGITTLKTYSDVVGDFVIPDLQYTPSDKSYRFAGWRILSGGSEGDKERYQTGETYVITGDTLFAAVLEEKTYHIDINAEHGIVEADHSASDSGETVIFTLTPDKGYGLPTALSVVTASGKKRTVTKLSDNTYSFVIPKENVTISVVMGLQYDLWVGNVQIEEANAADVLGDGTVSYDRNRRELTLLDMNLTNGGIRIKEDTTICLIGENTICLIGNETGNGISIHECDVTIEGPGTLQVYVEVLDIAYEARGIYLSGNTLPVKLTIKADVDICGAQYGIFSYNANSELHLASANAVIRGENPLEMWYISESKRIYAEAGCTTLVALGEKTINNAHICQTIWDEGSEWSVEASEESDGSNPVDFDRWGKYHYIRLRGVSYTPIEADVTISYSHTLTLQNNLSINYYVSASKLEGYRDVQLHVEKDTYDAKGIHTVTEEIIEGTIVDVGYGPEYKFRYAGIASYEIGNEVRAYIVAKTDAARYKFNTDTYSVKKYCYNQLGKSTVKTELKTLIVDLLNYGSKAQSHFGIRTNELVNGNLTAAQKAYGTVEGKSLTDTSSVTSLANAKATISKTLVLGNSVELKVYTKLPKEMDKSRVTLRLSYTNMNGKKVMKDIPFSEFVYNEKNDEYSVRYAEINAPEFRNLIDIAIYDNGTRISDLHKYSIETYAYNRMNSTTANASLKELVTAMMIYSDSAAAFFKNN